MKRAVKYLLGIAVVITPVASFATPSTQIWIPSTDIQDFGVFHITADMYLPAKSDVQTVTNLGLTVGILPFEKVGIEVGFDHINAGGAYPWFFNGKIGVSQSALFPYSPAIAAGIYNVGIKKGVTTYNMIYGLVSEDLPFVGRISAGYWYGNNSLLSQNHGLLLSWDRTISEISDKLWIAVDYQGGDDSVKALSTGFSWEFAENVSVIAGYVFFQDQVTFQVDIDF